MYTSGNKKSSDKPAAQQNHSAARNPAILTDNRPRSVFQAKALAESAYLQGTAAPIQRTISFKIGKQKTFKDIAHLKNSLKHLFAKKHHARIDELVDDADTPEKGTISVGDVYDDINKRIAVEEGWTRADTATASSGHGPVIPYKDSKGVGEAKQSAMSGFMMGSVTLLSAQLILPNRKLEYFQTKQDTDEGDHAEVVLMQEIDQYLNGKNINAAACGVRITINNAPCGTGGKKEKNCAGKLQVYAKKFKRFRIYYMRPFGGTMTASIKGMQKAGIKVSNFSPATLGLSKTDYTTETWEKVQAQRTVAPEGVELDPWSGSEDEKEVGKTEGKRAAPKTKTGKGKFGSGKKGMREDSGSDSSSSSEHEKTGKEKVETKRAAPKSKAGKGAGAYKGRVAMKENSSDSGSDSEGEKTGKEKVETKRAAPKTKAGKTKGHKGKAAMKENSSDSSSDSEGEKYVTSKSKAKKGKSSKGGKSKPGSKRKGRQDTGSSLGNKKAKTGKNTSVVDSRYISLDDFDMFEDVAAELTNNNVSVLNGYQVAKLLALFDNDPIGKYITLNEEVFVISKSSTSLPVTEYNPTGLGLVIRRKLRGG